MSAPLWSCGHPRTAENSIGIVRQICRTCQKSRAKAEWAETPPDVRHLQYRVRILPVQLERARHRVAMLEAEAARLGLKDLLDGQS